MLIEHSDPIWILDSQSLARYCKQWLELDAIALDTEFIRTDTFYPIPGLVQIGTNSEVFLADPTTISDWSAFGEVLQSPSVTKILHACSEDLEVFNILTGCEPVNLMDTQLAAAYAGLGHSLSYQNLLKHLLQIDVPKDATRSDWLQRPLTKSQISYAALDVVHLLDAYRKLETLLADKPHRSWLQEDCDAMMVNTQLTSPSEIWKDVKRAWQLRPRQLAALKMICEYREIEARTRDIPRNRVIPKGSLWPIARCLPTNMGSLSSIQDMKPNILRKDGKVILDLIAQAKALPDDQLPEPLPAPLPKVTKDYGKLMKGWVQHKAGQLEIPVELLFTSKMSNAILRHWQETGRFTLPKTISGWRAREIGQPLVLALQEHKR